MEKYIYFICNKDVNIVLTDDYFFYYGLKQLTGLPLFHITYEGVVNKSIAIKHKGRCEQVPDMRSSYSSGAHPRGTS